MKTYYLGHMFGPTMTNCQHDKYDKKIEFLPPQKLEMKVKNVLR